MNLYMQIVQMNDMNNTSNSQLSHNSIDPKNLQRFMEVVMSDLGGAYSAVLVYIGEFSSTLGAQAGEAKTGEVVKAGGFKRFRRAIQTQFNIVYEARP